MIGTINGYSESPARFGRKRFTFDGTTRGLVRAALANGAKVGDTVQADFGCGFKPMSLYINPMDDRCGGVWAR
jgi:hypothetical protein